MTCRRTTEARSTARLSVRLADMTTDEVRALLARGRVAVLVPVGSVEPHGPHLPLAIAILIWLHATAQALELLEARGIAAVVAPSVPYGVTDYAAGFAGAIGVRAEALTAFLRAVAERLLADGFAHVCFVNNHLEPAHDLAVRAAANGLAASVACPLTRRWGRTLTEEYKRGNCHAGQYETSLMLASGADVRPHALPASIDELGRRHRAAGRRLSARSASRARTWATRQRPPSRKGKASSTSTSPR